MGKVMHTPGPWVWYWRSTSDGLEADCGIFHEQRVGHAVSICRAPRYVTKEAWSANAAVMTAAPDMLEALENLVAACENADPVEGHAAIGLARAAISKAKGEST